MIEFPKNPHTAIITGVTGCGKTFFIMNLLTNEYLNYFDIVIILCPTFTYNETYKKHMHLFDRSSKEGQTTFIFSNDFEKDPLENQIDYYNKKFDGKEMLFILDDLSSNSSIVKKRTSISTLATSGRHKKRSLWVLVQKYNSVGKDVRAQSAWVCSFFCKDKKSFYDMIDENYTGDLNVKDAFTFLREGKRSKLFIKTDFPRHSFLCK